MTNAVVQLQAEWEALELELLIPAKLTDEDFRVISWARKHPSGWKFRKYLPLVVARFKRSAKRVIMGEALRYSRPRPVISTPYARSWQSDIAKINQVLFGNSSLAFSYVQLGLFKEQRAPYIHIDVNGPNGFYRGHAPTYTARLGALPVMYIPGQDENKLSKQLKNMIEPAQDGDIKEEARQIINDRKMLRSSYVGDVLLMLGGSREDYKGTLHCSSPVPPQGKHSAWFYGRGAQFGSTPDFK